jgi:hypothetical protein
MKGFLFLLFLVFYTITLSNTYYVSITGSSDTYIGTRTKPWATWQKAFETATAGDTVFFREGVWYLGTNDYVLHDPNTGHGHNGTFAKPVCFFNYPGENPILDAIGHTNSTDANAFDMRNSTYIYLKGLTVRNQRQNPTVDDHWIASMQFLNNGFISLDQITCHSGGGYGIWFSGYDTLYLINCDSYDHVDTLRSDGELGNRSDGFQISSGTEDDSLITYTYISGCRAWNNSDDGMEISSDMNFEATNNWMFCNGRYSKGAGTGVKFGPATVRSPGKRKIHNTLVAFNKGSGFADQNLCDVTHGPVEDIYNNTLYKNEFGFTSDPCAFDCETGYANVIYRNNVVHKSRYAILGQVYLTACGYEHQSYQSYHNNTWIDNTNYPYFSMNPAVTVTDADFELVDSAQAVNQLLAKRKPDGSLPDIAFMKLTVSSDLIDAGMDVGLGYNGEAPDMGAWECEYQPGTNNLYPTVRITTPSNASTFVSGLSITISTDAADADGYIRKVEFYSESNKLGESISEPWSFSWDNLPIGSFYLTAVATDNMGAKATSAKIKVKIRPGATVLYPNPNNGFFTFALTESLQNNSDLIISSLEGRIIYSGKMFGEEVSKQFNLTQIQSGLYFLVLYDNNIIEVKKFIKE